MARLKSEDKRNAILEAAAKVFAGRGLAAATSAISKEAGIAEGTLFTYFSTKDELVNALYCQIKIELADAMMAGFPRRKSIRLRLEHVWTQYIEWGLANRSHHAVLKLIMVWNGLTKESKKAGSAPFVEIEQMMEEALAQRIVKDLPSRFFESTMSALAENTLELIRSDVKHSAIYRTAGFEMLWGGFARK
jgi:AcrR family transcriptional regulator